MRSSAESTSLLRRRNESCHGQRRAASGYRGKARIIAFDTTRQRRLLARSTVCRRERTEKLPRLRKRKRCLARKQRVRSVHHWLQMPTPAGRRLASSIRISTCRPCGLTKTNRIRMATAVAPVSKGKSGCEALVRLVLVRPAGCLGQIAAAVLL